jgi:exonuclease III
MTQTLSFASWNVEHFRGRPERAARALAVVGALDPDLFAILEVEGRAAFQFFMDQMPGHQFSITENPHSGMEILIGARRSLQVFVTQREQFKSGVPTLRPGALVTVRLTGQRQVSFLFLHAKSFTAPRDWGLRDDMFKHAASLKRTLDKVAAAGARADFVCLGDLNTMGLNAPFNDKSDLDADQEIASLVRRFQRAGMRQLAKTHPFSWWNGKEKYRPGSQLDHAFAAAHLRFRKFGQGDAEIRVVGWPELEGDPAKRQWIEDHSDHGLLFGELLLDD